MHFRFIIFATVNISSALAVRDVKSAIHVVDSNIAAPMRPNNGGSATVPYAACSLKRGVGECSSPQTRGVVPDGRERLLLPKRQRQVSDRWTHETAKEASHGRCHIRGRRLDWAMHSERIRAAPSSGRVLLAQCNASLGH